MDRGTRPRGISGESVLNSDHSPSLPRSPEPSKTSALGSSEDAIEPVSPPEGMAEPGHPRSAMYPLLYRDGDQVEPRYLRGTPPHPWMLVIQPPLALVHCCVVGDPQGLCVRPRDLRPAEQGWSLRGIHSSFLCRGPHLSARARPLPHCRQGCPAEQLGLPRDTQSPGIGELQGRF